MRTPETTTRHAHRGEDGTSLILALVFITAIGLLFIAILNFATGALTNTVNLRTQRGLEFGADAAVNASVQWVRNTCPQPPTNTVTYPCSAMFPTTGNSSPPPTNCLPNNVASMTFNTYTVKVNCLGQAAPGQRFIDFYACTTGTCSATNSVLHANITFFDSDPSGNVNCSGTTTSTCGISMTINSWDVVTSDN